MCIIFSILSGDLTIMQSTQVCQGGNKRHIFFAIKLAAFQASGDARMRLRLAGFLLVELQLGENSEKIERRTSNAQHRTSNIDDAMLYRF